MSNLPDDYKGYTFSRGTLKEEHLLEKFIDFVETELKTEHGTYPEHTDLGLKRDAERILRLLELTEGDDEYQEWKDNHAVHIVEDIFYYMSSIAPEGCHFSAHPGDGALFGFWENIEECN